MTKKEEKIIQLAGLRPQDASLAIAEIVKRLAETYIHEENAAKELRKILKII